MRTANTVEAYADAFTAGESVQVEQLCGRIIRGTSPEDFETLTNDSTRKIVMLMGPDGLEQLPGRTGHDMLRTIGYAPHHIEHLVEKGMDFRLAVFPESRIARPATWDNMLDITGMVYPEVREDLLAHRDKLQQVPFAEIQQQAGFNFHEVDRNGATDSRYMTPERFLASPRDLTAARALLYFSVHLRELYSGDGYTHTAMGERGLQEYAILNQPLRELGNFALLDVEVELPTE
jgi:hypothetical protein